MEKNKNSGFMKEKVIILSSLLFTHKDIAKDTPLLKKTDDILFFY